MTPLLFLFYATRSAETVKFLGQHVELGFTPSSLEMFSNISAPVNEDLLKPIKSYFNHTEDDTNAAVSLIIDENFINYMIVPLIQGEQQLALREILEGNPKMALFAQLLTTKTIGTVIPSFKDQYKDSTRVDVIGTLSHEQVLLGLENAVPTGFSIDQKGNFKAHVNAVFRVVAETSEDNWEDARGIYMTLSLKGKAFIMNPEDNNRTLIIMQKSLELSNLKIYKGEDEQFLEQMLV